MKTAELPIQSRNLPDIHDLEPFCENDMACLDELRDVLAKHKATNRFGLHLLHSHFDLEPDEVLVEDTDVGTRVQTIKPIKRSEIPVDAKYTSWRFDTHSVDSPVCRISMQYH
ncbi:MAG: hypothetical protein HS117_25535 [Verrucomicrobiaceae bacterium]|nr:hypothetical protein [Verrucomicrobiaceae bacterium]